MHTNIAPSLTALGIPPRIAEVYAFIAEKGEVVARDVAETFSYTRSTAHDVLSTLVHYGFARAIQRGKAKVFMMESPHVLCEALYVERRKAETRVEVFEQLVPVLRALYGSGGSGIGIRYFTGADGLEAIQREFAGLSGDILQFFDFDTLCALDIIRAREYGNAWVIDRAKRVRSIVMTDRDMHVLPSLGIEIRTIPRNLITLPGEMSVCGDRVLLLSYAEEISVIEIRSAAVADVCRATLELAWKAAEAFGNTAPKE